MKKFSQIENVIDEIEFYEQRGYYQIADDLFKSFQKYAQAYANPSEDLYPGMNEWLLARVNIYACKIPECVGILCPQGGQNAAFQESFSNYFARNKGIKFTQNLLNFRKDYAQRMQDRNPLNNGLKAGNDPFFKMNKCLAALAGYGDQIEEILKNNPPGINPNQGF